MTPEQREKIAAREETARSLAERGDKPLQEVRVWTGTLRNRAQAALRAATHDEMLEDFAGCRAGIARVEELIGESARLAPADVWNVGDIALLAGCPDVSRRMLERLDPAEGTRLWRAYVASQLALHRGQSWRFPQGLILKGGDSLFRAHLEMVEALSEGKEPDLARVDEEFRARNAQKRWVDWDQLDGDAASPVKWNLRKEAALRRAAP